MHILVVTTTAMRTSFDRIEYQMEGQSNMKPTQRLRRLRNNETIRSMVSENQVSVSDLIYPMFVHPGTESMIPVNSMPGVMQYSVEAFAESLDEIVSLGIPAVLLFGLAKNKDEQGSEAYSEQGAVQQAIRLAKSSYPQLYLIGDVCLCAYTSHGHCGVVEGDKILNDASVELLAKVALSQARAGVDMVAPSDMMDGRVRALRRALDEEGFEEVALMSYAAKYASAFYGPFREAADSAPQFGDRRSYQMDPANGDEAMREIELDITEGADAIIVKPALAYGDIIYRAKQISGMPVAAYHVSGEYAMIKAAAERGFIDEKQLVMESLLSSKRAGADMLISYHAMDVARWL